MQPDKAQASLNIVARAIELAQTVEVSPTLQSIVGE
jgi:hypothetical protein